MLPRHRRRRPADPLPRPRSARRCSAPTRAGNPRDRAPIARASPPRDPARSPPRARASPAARNHNRLDVRLDLVHATLRHVRHGPQGAQLLEVVAVLGEPDLVHAGGASRFDERIDRQRVEHDLLLAVAEMHVVVDDHSSAATRSRSPTSVTLISFGSPSTTLTRPPRASTRDEQSLAAATFPCAYASRTT